MDRYYAISGPPLRGWQIHDRLNEPDYVDAVRSAVVAQYLVDRLNEGAMHVNPHGLLGCRVELGKEAA